MITVKIPVDARFPQLSRDSVSGDITFDTSALRPLLEANPRLVAALDHRDAMAALLVAWYRTLREEGYRNTLMEQLVAQGEAEEAFGLIRVQEAPSGLQ